MADQPTFLLSSGCLFHLPLSECARIARDAGFDGLELILNHPELLDVQQTMTQTRGMPILSLHAPFRQWSLWGGHLRAWEKSVILGNKLPELQNITLHPPAFKLSQLAHFWWYAKTRNLPEDLKANVGLSLENLPTVADNPFGRDPFKGHIEQCINKNVNLTLDVCHLGISNKDILQALDEFPLDILVNVHFSDARGLQEHLWPGDGELPLDNFLRLLREKKYGNLLTLEVGPATLPQKREEIVSKLKKFLDWVKNLFV
ncbi:sugar phosphate isomerase/epimerase [Desulfohalobiaceae bacterium Ax17]|uniref:sugar phosphate isomerase/epimerase family protein n=1 Tax=Desulfovulcanus ferrireducens TaxID=2831190 RepID=UPI00207BB521|nr:sugar phosphate isomerase/epimerase [Desulfovulcanus ferrireducens]MBT8764247.1 sugar phosphate isomerase/epimerase [Desulfovulcanus ferrireducens]